MFFEKSIISYDLHWMGWILLFQVHARIILAKPSIGISVIWRLIRRVDDSERFIYPVDVRYVEIPHND